MLKHNLVSSLLFQANFPLAKANHMMAKERDSATYSAYHEAKAGHRANLSIKEVGKYIPPKKRRVGEEVNICWPYNLFYNAVPVYKRKKTLVFPMEWNLALDVPLGGLHCWQLPRTPQGQRKEGLAEKLRSLIFLSFGVEKAPFLFFKHFWPLNTWGK